MMNELVSEFKKEGEFEYKIAGEGAPIIFLHGLMGTLGNFDAQVNFFANAGFQASVPSLPLYSMPLAKTSVKSLTRFVKSFIEHMGYEKAVLVGNSLGGHISLMMQKMYPQNVLGLVLAGSSGLYEAAMGTSYPRRGDRDYIAERIRDVFYVKEVATEELIDDVFATVNDRNKAIKTLAISKSAIRHNMSNDIKGFNVPTCIVWGKQDEVTPPDVAEKFHQLLPSSELYWIDKCGHAAMMEHPEKFNSIILKWLKNSLEN